MPDSAPATTAKGESRLILTLTEMKELLQVTGCYAVIALTFIACPAAAGWCIATLYYIVKDFPN